MSNELTPEDIERAKRSWNKIGDILVRNGYVMEITSELVDAPAYRLMPKGVSLLSHLGEIFGDDIKQTGNLEYTDVVVLANIILRSKPL
ncbi:MAG TPA: hypothetical protein VH595_08770 [Verrucomicrobiae bacterium]|jgi:hypothetical protein|nr:hypothetical protein [Verrucomicrobiae bacterium]